MTRTITEAQFEMLRRYEHGNPHWISGGPLPSLIGNGYLKRSLHDQTMSEITASGRTALAEFRTKYGIRDVAA